MEQLTAGGTDRRTERRVQVRVPVEVNGVDRAGMRFREQTMSENLCRGGVAFSLVHDIDLGVELELSIPLPRQRQREESDFSTRGQVCHIRTGSSGRLIGVRFIGPRFHHLFVSESAEA
jgi:hypothetical protein